MGDKRPAGNRQTVYREDFEDEDEEAFDESESDFVGSSQKRKRGNKKLTNNARLKHIQSDDFSSNEEQS